MKKYILFTHTQFTVYTHSNNFDPDEEYPGVEEHDLVDYGPRADVARVQALAVLSAVLR